jgi:hypothetical protein
MTDNKLQEVAQRIIELKRFQLATGVITSRSQGALIRDLDPIELSNVAAAVNKALASKAETTTPTQSASAHSDQLRQTNIPKERYSNETRFNR